jgi:hypothetical protein
MSTEKHSTKETAEGKGLRLDLIVIGLIVFELVVILNQLKQMGYSESARFS